MYLVCILIFQSVHVQYPIKYIKYYIRIHQDKAKFRAWYSRDRDVALTRLPFV